MGTNGVKRKKKKTWISDVTLFIFSQWYINCLGQFIRTRRRNFGERERDENTRACVCAVKGKGREKRSAEQVIEQMLIELE